MDRIRVIVKPVGLKAHVEYVENELRAFQKLVGGYIEAVPIAEDEIILCNEEGRLMGLPFNCEVAGINFVGDIALVGVNGEEFCGTSVHLNEANEFIFGR